jgi:uncharacterized protein YciI
MTDIGKEIRELIAPNLRRRLYVALSYPNVPQEEMVPYLSDHLRYMGAVEDKVFLSGPFIRRGQLVGEGLTILNAESVADATEFMRIVGVTRGHHDILDENLAEQVRPKIRVE